MIKGMKHVAPISIGALRVTGLALKLGLTLFLARYFSTADLGVYGLFVAVSSVLPGMFGFGLSYFTNREIVDLDYPRAILVSRDRIFLSAITFFIISAIVAAGFWIIYHDFPIGIASWAMVLLFEFLGFDINLMLISRGRAAYASFIFFIRTAFWVPFFILFAYLSPALRNLDALVGAWFCGGLVSMVLVFIRYWKLFNRKLLSIRLDLRRYIGLASDARLVWFSDIALALGQNVDRAIIAALAGPAAAGVYYFYFVTTLSTFQIVQAAVIQPAIPVIRRAFMSGSDAHHSLIRSRLVASLLYTSILTIAGQAAIYVIVIYTGKAEIVSYFVLSPLFALGAFSKTIAEFLGIVDYATERDRRYILVNLLALVLTVVGVGLLTFQFGLIGSVVGFDLAMIAVMALRLYFYRWVWL